MKKYITISLLLTVFSTALFGQINGLTVIWDTKNDTIQPYVDSNYLKDDRLDIRLQNAPSIKDIYFNDKNHKVTEDDKYVKVVEGITTIHVEKFLADLKMDEYLTKANEKDFILVIGASGGKGQMIFKFIYPKKSPKESDNGKQGSGKPLTIAQKQELIDKFIRDEPKYKVFQTQLKNSKSNIILEGNTVHVFIDEYKKTYLNGFPMTAREDFNYTFHVFYYDEGKEKNLEATFEGLYEPTFDVYGGPEKYTANGDAPSASAALNNSDGKSSVSGVKEIKFEQVGPYTSSFIVKINKYEKDKYNNDSITNVVNRVIKIAKTHHISLTAGLIGSYLSNPSNFEKYSLGNGDSTVIADDPTTRGMITLMATFYPRPRNLLFPATNWKERIGFVVGTRIDKDFNENFLCGMSYDLARGVSLTGGVHYGRVNKLVYDGSFDFGKTIYTGALQSKKEWQLGGYVGVNIDLRILNILFNPQPAN